MNPSFKKMEETTFIGFSTTVRREEAAEKCTEFWNKEYAEKYGELFLTRNPKNAAEKCMLDNQIGFYAISISQEESFEYMIAGIYKGGEIPDGFKLVKYPASKWAVFEGMGPIPESIQALNSEVWNNWFPTNAKSHEADPIFTIEYYSIGNPRSAEYKHEIWIPVKRTPLVAFCGLNCGKCDARIATINNDDNLRKKTSKLWCEMNNTDSITPETINCMGCRTDGIKFAYCSSMCEIRKCAATKGYDTCGECDKRTTCQLLAPITGTNTEAQAIIL